MSKSEAELEKSVSLMDQIQALISPPVSRAGANGKGEGLEERHPYYRRPGQGHNHDCCDACGEGGNLLCCDLCPASFHLTCHDPPLLEADIPSGLWSCHQCQYLAAKEKEKDKNSKQSVAKNAKLKTRSKNSDGKTLSSLRKSRTPSIDSNSSAKTNLKRKASTDSECDLKSNFSGIESCELSTKRSNSETCDRSDSDDGSLDEALSLPTETAMQLLIDAAAELNPTQFELPKDLTVPINFPGSDKPFSPKKVSSAHLVVGKKAEDQHISEDGIVPEPVRFCFECGKTCRYAPLIACDYCPLFFHLDCLDPPLTYFPASRWMCPAHPEHFIDSTLLTSTSVTERVRLWQRFNKPFDHHTVTLEFYRKAHLHNTMFPSRQPLINNNTVIVPESVKALYQNPPPALPTLKTLTRVEKLNRDNRKHFPPQPPKSDGPTEAEQEQWLMSLLAFQTDLANHFVKGKKPKSVSSPAPETNEESSENVPVSKSEPPSIKVEPVLDKGVDVSSGDISCKNSLLNGDTCNSVKTLSPPVLCNGDTLSSKSSNQPTSNTKSEASLKEGLVKETIGDASNDCKVPSNNSNFSPTECSSDPPSKNLNELGKIPDVILASADSCKLLNSCDPRLIHLLACQRLQQLAGNMNPSQLAFEKSLNSSEEEWKVLTKARATLSPLSLLSAPSVPMIFRTLTIGTDPGMDVCLSNYGHCDFISSKHAAVFFDEGTLHYELLNYSEYGTVVDNILYSCNISARPRPRVNTRSRSNKEGIKVKRPTYKYVKDSDDEEEVRLDPLAGQPQKQGWMKCKCHNDSSDSGNSDSETDSNSEDVGIAKEPGPGRGWEGSALMNHGSLVSFGCLKFVFSISEFSPVLYVKDQGTVKDFLDDCKVIRSSRMIAKDQPSKKKQRSSSTESSASSSSSTLSRSSKMEIESDESAPE